MRRIIAGVCWLGIILGSRPVRPAEEAAPARAAAAPRLVSLRLKSAAMEEVAQLLTIASGAQIAVSKGAAQETVSIYLEDIPLEDALKTICAARGLWYKRHETTGVIHIMTAAEFREGVSTYDEEAVEAVTIRYPRAEEIGETLKHIFQGQVVWTPPARRAGDRRGEIEDALERMDLMAERGTLPVARQRGGSGAGGSNYLPGRPGREREWRQERSRAAGEDRREWEPGSPPPGKTAEAIPAERLAEYAERKARGETPPTLAEILQRPGVVHIAAFPEANQLLLRSADRGALARVKAAIAQLDAPKPQVLLEVKVLDILVDKEHGRGVDWLFRGGPAHDRDRLGGGWARGITTPVGQRIGKSSPGLELIPQGTGIDSRAAVFSIVTEDIRARLQFLQDNNRITQLATPNLLVADNEASQVFVGSEETVDLNVDVTNNFDDEGNPTGPTISPSMEKRRIGTTLLITPRIHADRTVTIRILQEESLVGEKEPTVNGGYTRPIEERAVTTTVVAHDKHIVAIGGLIRERAGKRTRGIPGLQSLPLVGEIFRTTYKEQERHELLVLIRPHILLAPGEGEFASHAFLERASQHPAAVPGMPDLGVARREEMPLGEHAARQQRPTDKPPAKAYGRE